MVSGNYVAVCEQSFNISQIAQFAQTVGYFGDGIPPTWPVVPAWPTWQELLTNSALGWDFKRSIHLQQRICWANIDALSDCTYTHGRSREQTSFSGVWKSSTKITKSRVRQGGTWVNLHSRVEFNHNEFCQMWATLWLLAKNSRYPRSAVDIAQEKSIPGQIIGSFPVTHAQTEAYALASGDNNPIHTNRLQATALGLPGTVAHGLWLIGSGLEHIRGWGRNRLVKCVSSNFVHPVVIPTRGVKDLDIMATMCAPHQVQAHIVDGQKIAVKMQTEFVTEEPK